MKNIRRDVCFFLQFGIFVLIWCVDLYISNTKFVINWAAVKQLPDVISIYTILYLLFIYRAWKWKIFHKWLVLKPNLQGTWEGEIKTEREGQIEIIPTSLVIKQNSLYSISCTFYTKESTSHSNSEQIDVDENNNIVNLTYVYTNKSKATIREKSPIHYGAVMLEFIDMPKKELRGEYWTSRKTIGEINLFFKSEKFTG